MRALDKCGVALTFGDSAPTAGSALWPLPPIPDIVCMEIQNQRVVLTIKLNPKEVANPPKNSRDMTGKGHYGTGDFESSIKSMADFEIAKQYIEMAY